MKAFPSTEPIYGNNIVGVKQSTGMELRDYFAAKAMQGLLSNPKLQEQILKQGQDWIVESSYAWANSMMQVREKK